LGRGVLAICNIVACRAVVLGEVRALWTCGWVQVSPVGMQKTGNDVGRREERGMGIGRGEGNRAAGSKEVSVQRRAVGGR